MMTHPPAVPRWLIGLLVGAIVATGAGLAAWSVDLPYLAWSPGPVTDAIDVIDVEDGLATFPPAGELLVLTVLQQPINVYELVTSAIDPTIDVYRRAAVFREGETNEEYRDRQLGAMDQTIQTALQVALSRLDTPPEIARFRVDTVFGDFPAARVLEPGDVLLSVAGVGVTSIDVIRAELTRLDPGDVVAVTIDRDGQVMDVEVELGETTDDDGTTRTIIGVGLGVDPPLDIETNNVGGPSAGLMFTLSIIDLLSAGNLTAGHIVAGTGTIASDGSVGGIGGVRQKVAAAEAFGAEYMLVPQSNFDEAMTADRSTIELVPVSSVDDALEFLAGLDSV